MLGVGEDFLAKGLKTFFLSFLEAPPKSPLGLLSITEVPLVSGLRLELLDCAAPKVDLFYVAIFSFSPKAEVAGIDW